MANLLLEFPATTDPPTVKQIATVQDGPNVVTVTQPSAAGGWAESAALVEPTTLAVGGAISVSTVSYNAMGEACETPTVTSLTLVNGNLPASPAGPTAAAVELP